MDDNFIYDEDECLDHPNAKKIYIDILKSLNEFPNDSIQSKFFLPENLTINCRSIAAAFVMSLYDSKLKLDEVYNSNLYSTFVLSAVFGMQIYLKERSIEKNNAPYKVQTNKIKIKKAQNYALQMVAFGCPLSSFVEQVMVKFFLKLINLKENEDDKIDLYLSSSMLWGYYFAKEMVEDLNLF